MNLIWKGNQRYNEDINKATIRRIDKPIKMSIHKYVGCGDNLYFDCNELGINNMDLNTVDWDEAEKIAIEKLKDRCDELMNKVELVISEYDKTE